MSLADPRATGLTPTVQSERTFAGLEFRLSSTGWSRFGGAGFLAVWLSFWAVGETLVIWLLVKGGWALLTGTPPEPGREPLPLAPSLAVGAFLVIWLALWTVGGIAAFYELMRLVWSSDRIIVSGDNLTVVRRAGFLRRTHTLPRTAVRDVYQIASGPTVLADATSGAVTLTNLGSHTEQAQLISALRSELKLDAAAAPPPSLPDCWSELPSPDGATLLVPNPRTRRRQAFVAWLVALPLSAVAAVVLAAGVKDLSMLPLGLIATAVAVAAVAGATWLTLGRIEWRIEPGRIIRQCRFHHRTRPLFEGTAVILADSRDSDGDPWYRVEIARAAPPHQTSQSTHGSRAKVYSCMHDPAEPRRLAEWMAARAGLSVQDQRTPISTGPTAADLAKLLATSGRLGRWAARLLQPRSGERR